MISVSFPRYINHDDIVSFPRYINHDDIVSFPRYINHDDIVSFPRYINHDDIVSFPRYFNHDDLVRFPQYTQSQMGFNLDIYLDILLDTLPLRLHGQNHNLLKVYLHHCGCIDICTTEGSWKGILILHLYTII